MGLFKHRKTKAWKVPENGPDQTAKNGSLAPLEMNLRFKPGKSSVDSEVEEAVTTRFLYSGSQKV